jgi:hypothetical protein
VTRDPSTTTAARTGTPPRIAVVGTGWWSANHLVPSPAPYDGADLVARAERVRLHLALGYPDQYAPTAAFVRRSVGRTWAPARGVADLVAGRGPDLAPGRPAAAAAAFIESLLLSARTATFVAGSPLPPLTAPGAAT